MAESTNAHRLALLGDDQWSLCITIDASDRYQIVELNAQQQSVARSDHWRMLADDSNLDAVLVNGTDPATISCARELAMRGKPLIVRALASLPAEYVTEMSLYDAEGATSLIPWFDDRWQAELIQRWLTDADLGRVTSLQLERTLSEPAAFVVDACLTDQLLADVDLLRMLGGDYSQVTLIRSGGDESSFNTQTLQLAGNGLPDATCTYRRVPGDEKAQLRIEATANYASVSISDVELVHCVGEAEVDRVTLPLSSRPELQRNRLDRILAGDPQATNWRDLVRIYDIAEAMQRSLRRRRTIDLHFETTSERSQFKTHMAAIGCGVILWTMFGLIGMLLAGSILDPRDSSQVQADAAGYVLRSEEFDPVTEALTPSGTTHVQQIAHDFGLSESVVIIESRGSAAANSQTAVDDVDAARKQNVIHELEATGLADVDQRVVIRPLKGEWFARGMVWGRVLVFGPLGVYLVLQILLVIARPATGRDRSP